MISALAFMISIVAYGIRELAQHGQLRWSKEEEFKRGFWDDDSYLRKYKLTERSTVIKAPDTWYYRFFKIKYKESFPLSATFLVSFTDGYHLMQSIFFLSLSFGISQLINIYGAWDFPLIWIAILLIHWLTRRLAGK